jgi:hypothetical protein
MKLPKTRKVAERRLIGHLVGYKASNIFKIWIPQTRKVVEARDIDFDENKLYDPKEPFVESELNTTAPIPQVTVEIPTYKGDLTRFQPIDESSDEEKEFGDRKYESDREDTEHSKGKASETTAEMLPTSEATLTPESSSQNTRGNEITEPSNFQSQENIPEEDGRPLKEIRGDVDESNIIEGQRTRRPRREAYLTQLCKPPSELSAYFDSILYGNTGI